MEECYPPHFGRDFFENLQPFPTQLRFEIVEARNVSARMRQAWNEAASNPVGVTVTAAGARDASEIEPVLTAFARESSGGVIVAPSPITTFRRELIITLARQLTLPAIYPFRYFPKSGGLVSYGIDQMEQVSGGASYVDRVLRGENPGELPVQLPTRYELAVNLKTAKALGLKIPESFLLRADEVIE